MARISAVAFASAALDLALPPACAGCSAEGAALCHRCAGPLSSRLEMPPGIPMGLRGEAPPTIAQLEWCAPFTGTVRAALHQLKYGGERRLAGPLSEAMAARWRVAGAGGDLVCPVPVHADRERRRGYDQAVLLAEAMARRLDMPCVRLLRRSRNTQPQFELGRKARLTNVSGAFELSAPDTGGRPCRPLGGPRRRRGDHGIHDRRVRRGSVRSRRQGGLGHDGGPRALSGPRRATGNGRGEAVESGTYTGWNDEARAAGRPRVRPSGLPRLREAGREDDRQGQEHRRR